ncbi:MULTISPECIES: PHA/PHB synthase family protein [Sphingomonadaceae]|jgi:polyhydroxyalkanoate synthase|uniref:Polyhydroxyalkanoate synthase n=2 Tax=Sphingomonadales TaxID=204457 RepID=A0A239JAA5_9SPHN|nr:MULTISPECIES: alpha/beta fold hydrolase [Sphingomonadaceae]QDK32808.1 alpha/beta fold hydrolase [Sphingomonas sp. IC081]BBD96638.1 poly-beta-hydroxybutyrate polymerase [Sphingobium amiense]SNT02438.1 polyhydroxyalkanoate synthase [Sphingomonas laterariae]
MSAQNMPQAPDPLDGIAETLDRAAGAAIAQMTAGLSPITILQAFSDWGHHLAFAPGKQLQLTAKAARKYVRLFDYAVRSAGDRDAAPAIEPLPQDRRFADPAWQQPPFNLLSQAFLLNQQWWHAATTGVGGVGSHHEDMVEFTARQMLDILAPTNFLTTNPVLQRKIVETGGQCLVDGFRHLIEDMQHLVRGLPPAGTDAFRVGETVATARGKVVYRNRLIELIQYAPTTDTVRPEPILIVPAWIMKYYILDLSPENSLVQWLTSQGFTVFMISWHNPDSEDRDLDMEAYRQLGPMAALDAVSAITGAPAVHAVGYCLGGTLLSIAAATMAREGDDRLASVTLFAAQTEFSEPGELGLFIDEGQLNLLEKMMWSRGYLDSGQMGGAFQILKSNDLVWSRILSEYLMGERAPLNDLMAWNADGTRMPYAMHSQYLRRLFLDDDLAEGKYKVNGRTIALSAIRRPLFVVGTERDHVAPWHSVHKIHLLTGAEITFVLTSGGHNAGIVSEPGHNGRRYRVLTRETDGLSYDPEEWERHAEKKQGSWWTEWGDWLASRSGAPGAPPSMGAADKGYAPIADAPGHYVLER